MPPSPSDSVLKELRSFGLSYPGAHTKAPWPDHMDLAVNNKTFAYLSVEGEPLSISCKLPWSSAAALLLPFVEPTAYGLGESGWVTARFSEEELPPLDTLKAWVDESYRAQAPKRLIARIPSSLKPNGKGKGKGKDKTGSARASAATQAAKKSASKARPSPKAAAGRQLTAASARKAASKRAGAAKNGKGAKAVAKKVKVVKAQKSGKKTGRKRV
jgi:hypothetical protein